MRNRYFRSETKEGGDISRIKHWILIQKLTFCITFQICDLQKKCQKQTVSFKLFDTFTSNKDVLKILLLQVIYLKPT